MAAENWAELDGPLTAFLSALPNQQQSHLHSQAIDDRDSQTRSRDSFGYSVNNACTDAAFVLSSAATAGGGPTAWNQSVMGELATAEMEPTRPKPQASLQSSATEERSTMRSLQTVTKSPVRWKILSTATQAEPRMNH